MDTRYTSACRHETSCQRADVPTCELFDGYRLGEITRLIDVTASPHRDIVGQQLQRHDTQHRREQIESLGDLDAVVGELVQSRVAFGHDRDYPAAAGLHLFDVADDLLMHA